MCDDHGDDQTAGLGEHVSELRLRKMMTTTTPVQVQVLSLHFTSLLKSPKDRATDTSGAL